MEISYIELKHSDIAEPALDFQWLLRHPGDIIESTIKSYIVKHQNEKENSNLLFITSMSGYLVFIYWNIEVNSGVAIVIQFAENYEEDIIEWTTYVSKVIDNKPTEKEEMFNIFREKVYPLELTGVASFDIDWIEHTLEGKDIELVYDSPEYFVETLASFLIIFRWSFYFLNNAHIEDTKIRLSFHKTEYSTKLVYEDYFVKLIGDADPQFNRMLNTAIYRLREIPYDDQLQKFRKYFELIYYMRDSSVLINERIDIINANLRDLLELDEEYTREYINELIVSISKIDPDYDIASILLEVSDQLFEVKHIDLGKLIDGTVLELALVMEMSQKEEILITLANRLKAWGEKSLIGFINSITAILSTNASDRRILSKIIQSIEENLKNSWEGTMCLVETSILAQEYKNAFDLRFFASKRIIDPVARAEDMVSALIWILEMNEIESEEFLDLSETIVEKVEYIAKNLPPGDVIRFQFNHILEKAIENDRIHFINIFVNWLVNKISMFEKDDRISILDLIMQNIDELYQYVQIKIKVNLILFSQYLERYQETHHHKNLELADAILRASFNELDPDTTKYNEKLSTITRSLILSCTKYNIWEMIETIVTKFEKLVKDNKFADNNLLEIFIKAGELRSKVPANKISKDDVGLFISDEVIRMTSKDNQKQSTALKYLPIAKKLAINAKSAVRYHIYTTLEIKLLRITRKAWVLPLINSAKQLVLMDAYELVKRLFDEAFKLEIVANEEYDLINAMLKLTEEDLDILSADEIISYRDQLIQLAISNPSIASSIEILEHYKNGIPVLLTKGNFVQLNNFLLQAIKYGMTQNILELSDFTTILLDSFSSSLSSYTKNFSGRLYRDLTLVLHQAIEVFHGKNNSLVYELIILMIEANINLVKTGKKREGHLRSIILFNTIAYEIRKQDDNVVVSDETKTTLLKLFNELLSLQFKEKVMFEKMSSILNSAFFLYYIEEQENFWDYINDILDWAKKQMAREKTATDALVIGLLVLYQLYQQFRTEKSLEAEFRNNCIRLIDVALSFPKIDSEFSQSLIQLKNLLSDDLVTGFRYIMENYPRYLVFVSEAIIN